MNRLCDLLFGRKADDPEYGARLRPTVTGLVRYSRVLQDEARALATNPQRMRRLAHEFDVTVRDVLEGLRPANQKYERFHSALRRLVRIRSMQAHDTAKFVGDPTSHLGVPGRTLQLAAVAAEQVDIMCDELRSLGPDGMQDLLGKELVEQLVQQAAQ